VEVEVVLEVIMTLMVVVTVVPVSSSYDTQFHKIISAYMNAKKRVIFRMDGEKKRRLS